MNAYIEGTIDNVNRFSGTLQGRLAAGSGAVHFDRLVSALRALRLSADGNTVRLTARLTVEEVAELLNVQRLAQIFA